MEDGLRLIASRSNALLAASVGYGKSIAQDIPLKAVLHSDSDFAAFILVVLNLTLLVMQTITTMAIIDSRWMSTSILIDILACCSFPIFDFPWMLSVDVCLLAYLHAIAASNSRNHTSRFGYVKLGHDGGIGVCHVVAGWVGHMRRFGCGFGSCPDAEDYGCVGSGWRSSLTADDSGCRRRKRVISGVSLAL